MCGVWNSHYNGDRPHAPRHHLPSDISNERKADFFIVAGDLFDSTRVKIADIERTVELLKGFCGESVLVVPGNHDYFAGPDTELWKRFRRACESAANVELRAGSAAAGEVDEQRLRKVLEEKINSAFGRWDEERGRPERQNGMEKGVKDKWSRGAGEILKEWYAWQDLIAEREDIVRIEAEIDRLTNELAELDVQDHSDQELIDSHGALRSQLGEREVLEERVPRLQQELKTRQDDLREWPVAAAAVDAWGKQKTEDEERATGLTSELDTARRRESAGATVKHRAENNCLYL